MGGSSPRGQLKGDGEITDLNDQVSLQKILERWVDAGKEVVGSYADLAMFELRSAADALGVFVALNVMTALFAACAWIAGFVTIGLLMLYGTSSGCFAAAMAFSGAGLGAAGCWTLRNAVRDRIRLSYFEKSRAGVAQPEGLPNDV